MSGVSSESRIGLSLFFSSGEMNFLDSVILSSILNKTNQDVHMKIGIVGATGEVGRMMVKCLEEFDIPVSELCLFASTRSAGTGIPFKGKQIIVQALTPQAMKEQYTALLFSAGRNVATSFAPIAAEYGNTVIDNSSAYRRDNSVPLIIPEINAHVLDGYHGIISNPNCSTIQMLLALNPLEKRYGLDKVIVSTYQSVSGAGHKGIAALEQQRMGNPEFGPFPKHIDLNVIPQIGSFLEDGYCEEEAKMHFETNKILGRNDILVSATTVRVPTFYGHAENVYAEFKRDIDLVEAGKLLSASPSVLFYPEGYITPLELLDSNDSHVCRLRKGLDTKSIVFWNVGHNVRVGAATNAIRILKYIIQN